MRSKYEEKVAASLTEQNINFQYEPFTVSYYRPVRTGFCVDCSSTNIIKECWYTPDFVINDGEIFIESKGNFKPENRTALLHLLESCDSINRSNFYILFMRDNKFGKKRHTYSRWCRDHDIKCAVSMSGEVPKEWTS